MYVLLAELDVDDGIHFSGGNHLICAKLTYTMARFTTSVPAKYVLLAELDVDDGCTLAAAAPELSQTSRSDCTIRNVRSGRTDVLPRAGR